MRMKLWHELSLTFERGTDPAEVLRQAIQEAESAMETLADPSTVWFVGESRKPEPEAGKLTRYFEVWGRSTARVLLIDDMRRIEAHRVARTFDEGIEALRDQGPWDLLYLDFNLADIRPEKTGLGIMLWLESHPELLPRRIQLVTSDPDGREQMQAVIDRLESRRGQR